MTSHPFWTDHTKHDRAWVGSCPHCQARYVAHLTRDRIRVPTGFATLDRLVCGGWEPPHLAIFGGLTGTGKSLLGMNLCEAARSRGHDVLILSYEMAWTQWAGRMVARIGPLTAGDLEQQDRVFASLQPFVEAQRRHFAGDGPGRICVAFDERPEIKRLTAALGRAADLGVRVVLIDYLQLLRGQDRRRRFEELEDVVCSLKTGSLNHGLVCIALGQLNRGCHGRSPHVGDFFGASAIEHAADTIGLLDHTTVTRTEAGHTIVCRVKKNRFYGLRGGWRMLVDRDTLCMTELDTVHEEDAESWGTSTKATSH